MSLFRKELSKFFVKLLLIKTLPFSRIIMIEKTFGNFDQTVVWSWPKFFSLKKFYALVVCIIAKVKEELKA